MSQMRQEQVKWTFPFVGPFYDASENKSRNWFSKTYLSDICNFSILSFILCNVNWRWHHNNCHWNISFFFFFCCVLNTFCDGIASVVSLGTKCFLKPTDERPKWKIPRATEARSLENNVLLFLSLLLSVVFFTFLHFSDQKAATGNGSHRHTESWTFCHWNVTSCVSPKWKTQKQLESTTTKWAKNV